MFQALREPLRRLWEAAWPFVLRIDACIDCYVRSKDKKCVGHSTVDCPSRQNGKGHVFTETVLFNDGGVTKNVHFGEVSATTSVPRNAN